jgi:DNA-binding transcriptional LysR family regulator
VAVAEAGGFTRAADQLSVAQPTVTVAVQNLEARLGVALIDRTTRDMRLTADGVAFLDTARRIIRDFTEAVGEFRNAGARRQLRVRVAFVPGVALQIIGPVVTRFAAEFPEVSLILRDENSRGVAQRVQSGDVDFGLCSFAGRDPDLTARIIARDTYGVVCLASARLASKQFVRWADLDGETFIAFTDDAGPRASLDRLSNLPDRMATVRIEVANTATAEAILEAGLGVTALPALGAPPGRNQRLVYRPLVEPVVEREISLIRRRDRTLSHPAVALSEMLAEAIVKAAGGEHQPKPARSRST